jgi:hypothetical protein
VKSLLARLLTAFLPLAASARTLLVGEGREFPLPSAEIAGAHDGDTVLINPGSYFDCATVAQNRLEIAGHRAEYGDHQQGLPGQRAAGHCATLASLPCLRSRCAGACLCELLKIAAV